MNSLYIEEEDYALQSGERNVRVQTDRGLLQLLVLVLECFLFIPVKKNSK